MLSILAATLLFLMRALTLLVIADVLVGYFLDHYHPIRRFLDAIVQPMLEPIRRVMPQAGPLDFSPLILIILIELMGRILLELVL